MKRQVFFSFHYSNDNWRASQVRNMGRVSGESTFSDNEWEEVKLKSDAMIESWIGNQMAKRSCVVVLIGENTAGRKWINYEIKKAIELDKGIVGIYIHNLKDRFGNQDGGIACHPRLKATVNSCTTRTKKDDNCQELCIKLIVS